MNEHPRIEIMDTTLRDGEQTSGVSFVPHEKLMIARLLLEDLKVDRIEVASARVSEGEFDAVRMICDWAARSPPRFALACGSAGVCRWAYVGRLDIQRRMPRHQPLGEGLGEALRRAVEEDDAGASGGYPLCGSICA